MEPSNIPMIFWDKQVELKRSSETIKQNSYWNTHINVHRSTDGTR